MKLGKMRLQAPIWWGAFGATASFVVFSLLVGRVLWWVALYAAAMLVASALWEWRIRRRRKVREVRGVAWLRVEDVSDDYERAKLSVIAETWRTGKQQAVVIGPCQKCNDIRPVGQHDGRYVCDECRAAA